MKNIIKKNIEVVEVNGKVEEITITQDRATELVNSIYENNSKGIDLFFDNCELITELRNSNGFYTLGYDSFKDLASELFESGETQAKNMCLIAQSYGDKQKDGSYIIRDKENLKYFSATQLLYIRGLKGFNGSIVDTCEKYGIDAKQEKRTPTLLLRKLIAEEKKQGKELTLKEYATIQIEQKQDDTSNDKDVKSEDKTVKADDKDVKPKEELKAVKKENTTLKADNKTLKQELEDTRDFRKAVIKILNEDKTDKQKITAIKKLLQVTK